MLRTNLWTAVVAAALTFACASPTAAPSPEPHTAIHTESLEPYACGDIARLHTVGGIFLGSQPSAADFERARQGGVKTVIDLRHASEREAFDERAAVERAGLVYVNAPFDGASEFTDDLIDRVRAQLRAAERPVLLHCASGNRVGAVWIPWRVLDDGVALEQAVAEARKIGLKSPAYEAQSRSYVERHAD